MRTVAEIVGIVLGCSVVAVMIFGIFVMPFVIRYRNKLSHEKKMLPCPICGHRAITMHYTGYNNPYFFTAECGAYARRDDSFNGTDSPNGYFKNDPPMTEVQKHCDFCAGYGANVPQFYTRLGAVNWWNKVACSYGYTATWKANLPKEKAKALHITPGIIR